MGEATSVSLRPSPSQPPPPRKGRIAPHSLAKGNAKRAPGAPAGLGGRGDGDGGRRRRARDDDAARVSPSYHVIYFSFQLPSTAPAAASCNARGPGPGGVAVSVCSDAGAGAAANEMRGEGDEGDALSLLSRVEHLEVHTVRRCTVMVCLQLPTGLSSS